MHRDPCRPKQERQNEKPIYNPYNFVNCKRCGFARWIHTEYFAHPMGADHEFVEPTEEAAPSSG
jgi:hypothetical protein